MEPENHEENLSDHQDFSPNYNQMSEAEREAQFRRQHQEYIAIKLARKKQLTKIIKDEFGSSSSDQDDEACARSQSSQNQKAEIHPIQKNESVDITEHPQQIPPQKETSVFPISIKKGNEWSKQSLTWKSNNILYIQNYDYQIKTITKLKILAEPISNCNFKIKLSYHQTQFIFGIPDEPFVTNLPLCYYIFVKIIKERLAVAGFKLKEKINESIPGVPQNLIKNAFIYGKIYKKSQILGKWEERFVVINKDGLFSYKGFNQKHSMHIQGKNVKQLWTRFDLQEDFLIVKMWHQSKKTEFGVPLFEVLNNNNWIFFLFKMMGKGK